MERENFRLEALNMAERILYANYNNSVIKCRIVSSAKYPINPTTDDITSLAEKLIDFIIE